jgi:hypothetical protein
LEQLTSLVEVPLADRDVRQFTLPKSEVLGRADYTKQLKGKMMVRKFVLWQTNKDTAKEGDYPAYVLHFTDYCPSRQTPVARPPRLQLPRANRSAARRAGGGKGRERLESYLTKREGER